MQITIIGCSHDHESESGVKLTASEEDWKSKAQCYAICCISITTIESTAQLSANEHVTAAITMHAVCASLIIDCWVSGCTDVPEQLDQHPVKQTTGMWERRIDVSQLTQFK